MLVGFIAQMPHYISYNCKPSSCQRFLYCTHLYFLCLQILCFCSPVLPVLLSAGDLYIMVSHYWSSGNNGHFLFSLSPMPHRCNSLQHNVNVSGQLMQQASNKCNKQVNATNKQMQQASNKCNKEVNATNKQMQQTTQKWFEEKNVTNKHNKDVK